MSFFARCLCCVMLLSHAFTCFCERSGNLSRKTSHFKLHVLPGQACLNPSGPPKVMPVFIPCTRRVERKFRRRQTGPRTVPRTGRRSVTRLARAMPALAPSGGKGRCFKLSRAFRHPCPVNGFAFSFSDSAASAALMLDLCHCR